MTPLARIATAWGWVCLLVASACANDRSEPATQIIVAVQTQLEPTQELARLELVVETDDGTPTDQRRSFAVVADDPGAGEVVLPAAITIVPAATRPATRFRLSVVAFRRDAAGEVEWARQTASLTFAAGKTLRTSFVLASACAMQPCPGQTCYPRAWGDIARGRCGPVAPAETVVIEPPASDDSTALAAVLAAGGNASASDVGATGGNGGVLETGNGGEPGGKAATGPCASAPCEHGGRCVPNGAGFLCSCTDTGFEGMLCEHDIDECAQDHGGCAPAAQCSNQAGSHRCECPDTHWGDGVGATGCEPRVSELAAGNAHTCALLATGAVKCWGQNAKGQLGDGTLTDRSTPVLVNGLSEVVKIATGVSHTCAITSDHTLHCWGANERGQLGDGTTMSRSTPALVSGGLLVQQVAAGSGHTCASGDAGIWCWGSNDNGQLGDGTRDDSTVPVEVDPSKAPRGRWVTFLSAGGAHSCAAHSSGVICWGAYPKGQTADEMVDTSPRSILAQTALSLSSDSTHTCMVSKEGKLFCWGIFPTAWFTQPDANGIATIMGLGADDVLSSAATGFIHGCGVLSNRTVKCWGINEYGNLGDGTRELRTAPQLALGVMDARQVVVADHRSCALLQSGAVQCWGESRTDSTFNSDAPIAVRGF